MQQRLEPALVLHPLGQLIADDADVIAGVRSSDATAGPVPPRPGGLAQARRPR